MKISKIFCKLKNGDILVKISEIFCKSKKEKRKGEDFLKPSYKYGKGDVFDIFSPNTHSYLANIERESKTRSKRRRRRGGEKEEEKERLIFDIRLKSVIFIFFNPKNN